ncbi:MAG: DUF1080 domain-containing protein [Chitinophagaceae bacterium]|nr:DUF1080 domain-containing protein [Chitinophagaceae bacterium]MCW5927634.1 DUF1080 domain-containing protein [Chitinophagaceae bacterium]
MRYLKLIFSIAFCSCLSLGSLAQGKWQQLFNGKNFSGWKQLGGKAVYTVENGAVVGTTVSGTPNSFLTTEKPYGDFVLELEVLLPDTTTNSGIQFRSIFNREANEGKGRVQGYQYELDASARAWTGGIYDEGRRGWLYPLTLNPAAQKAFKHGEFNKVRIECIGNTIKTWLNGVPAAYLVDELTASGFIALQVHSISDKQAPGTRIVWKNIRIQTGKIKPSPFPADIHVVNNLSNQLTPEEVRNGWKLLFDGKTSAGWRSSRAEGFPEKGWSIENGEISVIPNMGNKENKGGDIITTGKFSAFDISFDFKLTTGANSGFKYFVYTPEGTTGVVGLEYQVLDDKNHPDAKNGIEGNRRLASLYDLIPAQTTDRFVKAVGEWNTARVVVYPDNHVEHYLNGIKVLEYERGSEAFRKLVAGSKFRDFKGFGEIAAGPLMIQDHDDKVYFRNIRIKELK